MKKIRMSNKLIIDKKQVNQKGKLGEVSNKDSEIKTAMIKLKPPAVARRLKFSVLVLSSWLISESAERQIVKFPAKKPVQHLPNIKIDNSFHSVPIPMIK